MSSAEVAAASENIRSVKDDLFARVVLSRTLISMDLPTQAEQSPTRHSWLIVVLILVILAVGAFLVYSFLASRGAPVATEPTEILSPKIGSLQEAEQYVGDKSLPPAVDSTALPAIEDDEHVWGSPTAAVTIVMYGNLTGDYSRLLIPAIKSLVDSSNGSVNLVFRNYPLTENELDYDAAELGECTYVQLADKGYWSYVDRVLAQQPTSVSDLVASVTAVGGDATLAQTCLDREDTWDYVVAQKQSAQLQAKIFVAPSFIIVNRKSGDTRIVEGLNTVEYIKAVVDDVR